MAVLFWSKQFLWHRKGIIFQFHSDQFQPRGPYSRTSFLRNQHTSKLKRLSMEFHQHFQNSPTKTPHTSLAGQQLYVPEIDPPIKGSLKAPNQVLYPNLVQLKLPC